MNNPRTIQTDGTAAREQLKAEINREELVERIAMPSRKLCNEELAKEEVLN